MQWSTFTSNQSGSLTSNGPYLILTTGCLFVTVQRPQVIQLIKSIEVGKIELYGNAVAKDDNEEKKDIMDDEQVDFS